MESGGRPEGRTDVGPGFRLLDRYEIVRHIGTGGMGTVWEARDLTLDQTVALKSVGFAGQGGTDAEQSRLRMLREARFAAQLRDHPNVVSIYDVQEVDGDVWLVLEYLPSKSLADVVAGGETLDIVAAARVGAAVAAALAAAHRRGIIHRDLKPGNVLLGLDGQAVKLTDFGISHAEGEHPLTSANVLSGTPAYMSREVARGDPETAASDVFSLGATLYKVVEGRPPFGEDDNPRRLLQRVANGYIDPPQRAGPFTPLLLHLMEFDPPARPDATAAQWMLGEFARRFGDPNSSPATVVGAPAGPPGTGGAVSAPPHASGPRRSRRTPVLVGTAVVAALGLLAAGLVFALRTDPTAVPQLPDSVPQLSVSDQRAADPCALLDPVVMERFGGPTEVGPGNDIGACRLSNYLPGGRKVVTEVYFSDRGVDDLVRGGIPGQDLGGLQIIRTEPLPSFGCRSRLRFDDGSQVGIGTRPTADSPPLAALCAVHEAALAVAVDRLAENGITYTPGWQKGVTLAGQNACELPGDTPEQIAGLAAAARLGFPNGSRCYIGDASGGRPYVIVTLGLEPAGDISNYGTAQDVDGTVAYTRAVSSIVRNPNGCEAFYPHRLSYDGGSSGPTEFVAVNLSGTQPTDVLCGQAVSLAAAIEAKAPG